MKSGRGARPIVRPKISPTNGPICTLWVSPESVYVKTSGGNITEWIDRTGFSIINPSQSTSGNRPAYTTNTKATFAAASSQNLVSLTARQPPSLDGSSAYTKDKWTVGIRFQMTSTPTAGNFYSLLTFGQQNADLSVHAAEVLISNIGGAYKKVTVGSHLTTAPQTGAGFDFTLDTNKHNLIVSYSGGLVPSPPGDYTFMFDGTSQTSVNSGSLARVNSKCSIGARVSVAGVITAPANSDIICVTVFNQDFTTTQMTRLNEYLNTLP